MSPEDDDFDEPPNGPRPRSRTSKKGERVASETALLRILSRLGELPESAWARLGVSEETQDGLKDAKKIKDPGARARHLKHVRAALRSEDWAAVERRIEQFAGGQALEPLEQDTAPHVLKAAELVLQGDRGLARFVEEYPRANRVRLKQLIRGVLDASEAKRPRARSVLESAVLTALESSD